MSPTHEPESSSGNAAQGATIRRHHSSAQKAKTTRIRKTIGRNLRDTTVSGSKRGSRTIIQEHHHFHTGSSPQRKIFRQLQRLDAALTTLIDRVEALHKIEARHAACQHNETLEPPPITPRHQRNPTSESENGQVPHPLPATPPLQRDQSSENPAPRRKDESAHHPHDISRYISALYFGHNQEQITPAIIRRFEHDLFDGITDLGQSLLVQYGLGDEIELQYLWGEVRHAATRQGDVQTEEDINGMMG